MADQLTGSAVTPILSEGGAVAPFAAVDALLLDLDGVITRTDVLHAAAWKRLFDDVLEREARGGTFRPFDEDDDYRTFVDGKPRLQGLKAFLDARGLRIPEGSPADGPETYTLHGLAALKDVYFHDAMRTEGVEVFPSSLELIELARHRGLKLAVISSSKNTPDILAAAGIGDLFDVTVDGNDLAALGLHGKPQPDVFVEAAHRIGVTPARAAVIEDAVSGVVAGKDGGFALVIGVDRSGHAQALIEAGADIVVADLSELLPGGGPPLALKSMNAISAAMHGKRIAVFLDYDGTVTPIVDRPQDAVLSDAARTAIEALTEVASVAFISGRAKEEVRAFVGLENVVYAGSHGFDIEGPGGLSFVQEDGARIRPLIGEAAAYLKQEIGSIPGVLVEDKSFAIAVHFRLVAEADFPAVEKAVDEVAARYPELRKTGGKKVFELRPVIDWHKGKAVAYLMETLGLDGPDVLTFYLGDDVTDQDAFNTLRGRGIGILVSEEPQPTTATFRVRNTDDVRIFLECLTAEIDETLHRDEWTISYDHFDPGSQQLREAVLALGNGYFGSRAAFAEAQADATHYPGTYVAGGFNRLVSEKSGQDIENEDLVNMPNWLCLNFRFGDGDWLDLSKVTLLSFYQELDLRSGILIRDVRFRDADSRTTRLRERRIVHMGQPHLAAIEVTILPEDWSGRVEIRSALDGTVENKGVDRYRDLKTRHLEPVGQTVEEGGILSLQVRTNQSRIEVAQAARTQVFKGFMAAAATREPYTEEQYVREDISLDVLAGSSVRVEKVVAMYTSRDRAISEPGLAAREAVAKAGPFSELLRSHAQAWSELWDLFDIDLDMADPSMDGKAQRVLRLHIFQMLQTLSLNTIDLDAGAPARGLHGEAYRGHIFWDELFIFPTLNMRMPEVTRSLLRYRERRLDAARELAREAGHKGAMYPWQSGSDGREESQKIHLNPKSGRWVPDNSQLQRHVNAAIAYNIWHYFQATGDLEFIRFHGAEMMLEIARFWANLATYNPDLQRYEILNVMGPDEYHDGYPESDEPGLNNNTYTNVMAVWTLMRTFDMLDHLPMRDREALLGRLGIGPDELKLWDEVSRNMRIVTHGDGILSQFEGYEDLAEFDWDGYRAKYGDIQRLDRVLEAEGDSPNHYKASKQADVLMLFFLLSAEELKEVFDRLKVDWAPDSIPQTIEYYYNRTSHGSTLSRLVHAWVLSRSDRPRSWDFFMEALMSDVEDIQGGTTPEGIHLGAMAGSVDLIQRCYAGIELRDDTIRINPCLPEALSSLSFTIFYRGHAIALKITHDTVQARIIHAQPVKPFRLEVRDHMHEDIMSGVLLFSAQTGERLSNPER